MKYKINQISFVFSTLAVLALSLTVPFKAGAQYYSQPGEKKEISIDKKVRSVGDAQYFDNIEASRKIFYEKDVVEFEIKVVNNGNTTLNNITVKDTLPKYLGLIFYPGTYNQTDNTLEWKIDSLEAGKSKTFLIRGKINGSTVLTTTTRQTNTARVSAENLGDIDNASYFVGKVIVPDTGASDIIFKTVFVISLAASGFFLRKVSRGY